MSETVRKIENKSLDNQKNPPETIKMPMLVFGLNGKDSIIQTVRGEFCGTKVLV